MKRLLSCILAASIVMAALTVGAASTSAAGKGDFNNDGLVNTTDVRDMMTMVAYDGTPSQQQLWWGDFSVNGVIDTSDARDLLRQVMLSTDASAIDYAHPTGDDWWGEKSIAVLGDSISFGAGAADPLPQNSYISYVKRAVQAANGGNMNYGFASAYPTVWVGTNQHEIHKWPVRSENADGTTQWTCDGDEDGKRLISVGMTSVTPWSTITYTLRSTYVNNYDYFCVYYHAVDNGGMFCIANGAGGEVADVNGSKLYVTTATSNERTKRTAFYRLSDCPKDANGLPQITICHDGTTNPVTITGIGYYKDISGDAVTFNSYTRGGISLVNMSDMVLSQVAASDTLILGLGFNDALFNYNRVNNGEFADRIDYLINAVNENGTQLIVNDYCWDNPAYIEKYYADQSTRDLVEQTRLYVKSELQRLARETGGVYIDQPALLGQAINDDLNSEGADGIHPTSAGHRMMAKQVVAAMGLEWTEAWT